MFIHIKMINTRECDFASFVEKQEDVRECGQWTACTSGSNPTASAQFRTSEMNHICFIDVFQSDFSLLES